MVNEGSLEDYLKARADRTVEWNTQMKNRIAVSIPEAAAMCGIGKSTVYRLIDSGKLRRKKLGKRALILVSDLEEYIFGLQDNE